jgi:hypothetical protein
LVQASSRFPLRLEALEFVHAPPVNDPIHFADVWSPRHGFRRVEPDAEIAVAIVEQTLTDAPTTRIVAGSGPLAIQPKIRVAILLRINLRHHGLRSRSARPLPSIANGTEAC